MIRKVFDRGDSSEPTAWLRGSWCPLLLLVLLVAAFVRGYRLGVPYFFSDEAFTWRVARWDVVHLLRRCGGDTHPPGHFLAVKAWMGVWGSSPAAMRSLSACCGVLTVALAYVVCSEALLGGPPRSRRAAAAARQGALFAACWTAVHMAQVTASRTARMYALGALLAGVTSWLLLRALRAETRRAWWWSAYGAGIALFCYIHSFAFFTVAAQVLFVGGDLLRLARAASVRRAANTACGFLWAATVALVLYSPWLPVFLAQAGRVRERFWIRTLTANTLEESFVHWSMGMQGLGHVPAVLCFAASLSVAGCMIWRRDRAGLFFLVQAATPWGLTLAISHFGARPLLQDRYLTFSQLSWMALWGVACARLPALSARMVLGVALLLSSVFPTARFLQAVPEGTSPMIRVMAFLKQHCRSGDAVVTESPAAVHVVRYHAELVDIQGLDVRCRINYLRPPGHANHMSALTTGDILWEGDEPPPSVSRVWSLSRPQIRPSGVPEGWQKQLERTFKSGKGFNTTDFTLALYVREDSLSPSVRGF